MSNTKRFLALILCAALLLSNVIISTPSISAATVDSYISSCTTYPANLTVKTTVKATMMSYPCSSDTQSASAATHIIPEGTILNVSALYKNTAGEYWYKVDRYGTVAYINGADTTLVEHLTGDVTATDIVAPGSLADGSSFPISGTISSSVNELGTITAAMYWGNNLTIAPVMSASDEATNNTYALASSTIDYNMAFNSLATGIYTYTLTAEVISYYVDDNGQLAKSVKDLMVERHRCIITDYTNPNEITGYGVDLSYWNGDCDFSVLKDEVDFVILRASWEYTVDSRFDEYAQGCVDNDIPFGVYVYSYAESVAEAVGEAEAVLKFVKNYDMELPIYFDAEDKVLANTGAANIREITKAFIEVIQEAGYECGIYTTQFWLNNYYTTSYFNSIPKWVAQINNFYGDYTVSYNGGVHIWQYSWEGRLDGDAAYDTDQNYYYDLLPGQTNDTSYRASCTAYTSNLMVKTNSSVTVMKYPCNSSVSSTSTSVKTLASGTEAHVTALYKNTAGEYWYEVDGGYIPASSATVTAFLYDDVGIYNPAMASNLDVGASYYIKGFISATSHVLSTVHAKVYAGEDTTAAPKISSKFSPDNKKWYSLYYSRVDSGLSFGNLSAGYYTYEISADVKNYYINGNGILTCEEENVVVYTQPFTVGGTAHSHTNVSTPDVAATCTSTGMSASTYCSVCGKIASGGQVIPMLGHNYTVTTIPGNCQTHEGQYRKCTNCGEESYTYDESMYSDWSATAPTGVAGNLIQTKQQYRSATVTTTTSTSASLDGYTLLGSAWDAGTAGSVVYAPNISSTGFSTSSSLYTQYNKASSKVAASETDTKKVVINSDTQTGYLYYHWCYSSSYYSVESKSGSYTTFHAYHDTTDPSNYTCDTSDMSYKTSHSTCSNSNWWFVTEVSTQSYTTYGKIYTHGKPGTWSAWGDTPIASSDSLMVEERTMYRYVNAPYGDHTYVNGVCSVCGAVQSGTTTPTTPAATDYYLIGYINGADYGCEGDYENMGDYKFVDGKVTATFTQNSYVFVKTTDNAAWYMTNGWVGEVNSATLYTTDITGENSNKLYVPGGVQVTFTLVENADGSLTLSYVTNEADGTLTAKSFSLSFESEILVNLYFTAENVNATEMGMLVFYTNPGTASFAAADEVYNTAVYNESTGRYMSTTDGIAAKEMGDTRYYAAYAKQANGNYIYSSVYDYSPKKYALNMLGKASTSATQKSLCVAMLNYGAEAQKYFSYNTGDLMNATLTADQLALAVDYAADLFVGAAAVDSSKIGNFAKTGTGFSSKTATVSFEGAFAINYYFTPNEELDGNLTFYYWNANDYAAAATLSPSNATGKLTMEASGDGSYWAEITGIAAKEMDDTYYVVGIYTSNLETRCTGVIAYSLSKYCMGKANNASSDMCDLCASTIVYGYHAKLHLAQ